MCVCVCVALVIVVTLDLTSHHKIYDGCMCSGVDTDTARIRMDAFASLFGASFNQEESVPFMEHHSPERLTSHKGVGHGVGSGGKAFTSLVEALAFHQHFLNEVLGNEDDSESRNMSGPNKCATSVSDIADWIESRTHSSAFTGIGAPETALRLLHRAVQEKLPERKVGGLPDVVLSARITPCILSP